MYVFKEQDNLIYQLHPLTVLAFVAVVFILSLVFSHPVFLLGLFAATGMLIISSGNWRNWKPYLKFCFYIIAIIILINAVFSQAGATVLFTIPVLIGRGSLSITLEAVAYGLGMSLRLLVLMSIFCLYAYVINPDKMLGLFGNMGNKSILTITLSARLFPLLIQDFQRISEVQRCRGVKVDAASWRQRLHNVMPICSVLLMSSLDRSIQLAESMYARGYATGKRTNYDKEFWRPRDYVILTASGMALLLGVGAAFLGWCVYSYYPRMEEISAGQLLIAAVITLILSIPVILNRGWMKWPQLRSRI